MDKFELLKEYFGHSTFRRGQAEVIDAILAGRDALAVMPTGAGKSVCYQIPALLLPGITIVVSPLISLMKDQVASMTQIDVPVAFINSSLTAAQYQTVFRRAEEGKYKIIYVAPERLATADFMSFAERTKISLVAVDEAHCVSQWGQDFRPSYLKIVDFIEGLSYRPVVAAFTATATEDVKVDIARILKLQSPLTLTTGFDRANLYFEVVTPKSKPLYLRQLVGERAQKSGIIYCATRSSVEKVCDELCASGFSATRYHAGLGDAERRQNQEDFVYDRCQIMVATNAFGMGIDKSNVSFVIHYNMPKNLESYYQEAGRAGRDGEKADCILLFSNGDVQTAKYLIQNTRDNSELEGEELSTAMCRDMERLAVMIGYCKTNGCLRAYILNYFGEEHSGECGNCSGCKSEYRDTDITVCAQKILSCVARVDKKYRSGLGVTVYVRALCGSRDKRILELGLESLPTYGIMSEVSRTQIREYIDYLIKYGYLYIEGDEYPVLRLGERAQGVLFCGESVIMPIKVQPQGAEKTDTAKRRGGKASVLPPDDGIISALKALRTQLARDGGVPPYVIFSNASLIDMAEKMPRSIYDFLQVSGVGEVKAKRYGAQFLEVIGKF